MHSNSISVKAPEPCSTGSSLLVGAISVIDWWAAVAGMIAVGVVMEVDRFLENRKKGEIL
jgi:hypothetical protein